MAWGLTTGEWHSFAIGVGNDRLPIINEVIMIIISAFVMLRVPLWQTICVRLCSKHYARNITTRHNLIMHYIFFNCIPPPQTPTHNCTWLRRDGASCIYWHAVSCHHRFVSFSTRPQHCVLDSRGCTVESEPHSVLVQSWAEGGSHLSWDSQVSTQNPTPTPESLLL